MATASSPRPLPRSSSASCSRRRSVRGLNGSAASPRRAHCSASRVRLAGETEELLASHHRLTGPRREDRALPARWDVIEESHAGKQSTLLVRTEEPVLDPAWTVRPVSLEDMVLAYMSQPGGAPLARRPGPEVAS